MKENIDTTLQYISQKQPYLSASNKRYCMDTQIIYTVRKKKHKINTNLQ